MLEFCTKIKNFQVFSISSNGGVFSTVKPPNKGHIGDAVQRLSAFQKVVIRGFTVRICGFCHTALQSFKCVHVECGHVV